jgi:hypothetical protein
VPRRLLLRPNSHIAKTESRGKQGNNKLDRPSSTVTSLHPLIFDQRPLWHAPAGLDCARWPWHDLVGHTDLRVRRRSAAAIASHSSWQRDQHGCNQCEKFSSQCHNSQPLGKKSAEWSTTDGTGLSGLESAKQKEVSAKCRQNRDPLSLGGLNPVAITTRQYQRWI